MNLYEIEEKRKKNEQNKKINKLMIIAITIIVIIMIVLFVAIKYLKANPSEWTVSIDGTAQKGLEDLIQFESNEDGTTSIYVPIKKMAEKLGYKAFNGTPEVASETTDNCYARNDNEVVIFEADSNIIYKKDQTINNAEYEYCVLDKEIKKEEELYIDIEGLCTAFNLTYSYSEQKKTISIYTLDAWVQAASKIATNKGYAEMDATFVNQKAVLENMIVVISDERYYGVIDYETGNTILGPQYEAITYIPEKSAFLIKKDGKVGMIASDGTTKISANYDSLTLIDNKNELYLASSGGLYGVIDANGKTIIYMEYDKIGIDVSNFEKNDVKTGYVLLDKLIPVQQNGLWGFFDIEGKKITDIKYDDIGAVSDNRASMLYNLLLIKDYNVVVVEKNGVYGFIDTEGKEVISLVLKDTYIETSAGETTYKMINANNLKSYNVIDRLESVGVEKVE